MRKTAYIILLVMVVAVVLLVINGSDSYRSAGPISGITDKVSQLVGGVTPGSNTKNRSGDEIPGDLLLPFDISDLRSDRSGVNPLGVVRTSKDVPPPAPGGGTNTTGHGGIDMPLLQGSNIYAVADGEIVHIVSASDPWGGMGITQLLTKTSEGEGWAFLYEHITPVKGMKEGVKVKKGEMIATKTAPNAFTAHFQLDKVFHNYEYNSQYACWPDQLVEAERAKLDDWFYAGEYKDQLLEGWRNVNEDGNYTFRGLLDEDKFPDSPQWCYSVGTDVRMPVN